MSGVAEPGPGTPGWDAGYRAGFQDGNSDIVADWEAALDGLGLEAFPTVVAAEIRRLRERVEDVDGLAFVSVEPSWGPDMSHQRVLYHDVEPKGAEWQCSCGQVKRVPYRTPWKLVRSWRLHRAACASRAARRSGGPAA